MPRYAYTTLTFITEVLHHITHVQLLKPPFIMSFTVLSSPRLNNQITTQAFNYVYECTWLSVLPLYGSECNLIQGHLPASHEYLIALTNTLFLIFV